MAGKGRSETGTRTRLHAVRLAVVAACVVAGLAVSSSDASAASAITSTGPLTKIEISETLNCSVNHAADTEGEFFGDTACGTFVAVGGTTYGPSDIPAGESLTGLASYLPFTPVSQTPVTGTGTGADPFKIVTVVDLGTTGLRLTETDTYVVGQESYRTDVTLTNNGGSPQTVVVYRAGDCYLQDSDTGFGAVDQGTGSVSCVGVMDVDGTDVPSSRIEQWRPLTPGSSYYEAFYDDVWDWIGTRQPFNNTCRCNDLIDNGAGLSWTATIPAGGSQTFSHLMSFSPAGNQPLGATKTADAATVAPGGADGYTITISNPNVSAVTLTSITDTLPAGFSYIPGSTTGATTTDPQVAGQVLTWTGPFTVPASGNVTLHFGVTAASTPGTYFNNAGAESASFAVAPTGDTAPITVSGDGGGTTTTTSTPGSSTTTTTSTPGSTTTTTSTSGSTTTTTDLPSSTTTTASPSTTTSTSTSTTATSTVPSSTSTTTTLPSTATTTTLPVTTTTTRPANAPTANVNRPQVVGGEQVTVFGANFPPNTPLDLIMFSDPVRLGTTVSDSAGSYTQAVTIPVDTSLGVHEIVVSGGGAQASTRVTVVAPGTVTAAPKGMLARTGSTPEGTLWLALLGVVAGAMLLTVSGDIRTGRNRRGRRAMP